MRCSSCDFSCSACHDARVDELVIATLSGVIVTALAWLIGDVIVGSIRRRRERRAQIMMLVARANLVAFRALRDGLFQQAWIEDSHQPLKDARAQYDDITAEALSMFVPGEEAVATWTAVELYAGWYDPFHYLIRTGTSRAAPAPGEPPIMDSGSADRGVVLPRHGELAGWTATWRNGDYNGPRYGDMQSPGDFSRHEAFPPHTDVVTDMLQAPVMQFGEGARRLSKRERARLIARYGWSSEVVEKNSGERRAREQRRREAS